MFYEGYICSNHYYCYIHPTRPTIPYPIANISSTTTSAKPYSLTSTIPSTSPSSPTTILLTLPFLHLTAMINGRSLSAKNHAICPKLRVNCFNNASTGSKPTSNSSTIAYFPFTSTAAVGIPETTAAAYEVGGATSTHLMPPNPTLRYSSSLFTPKTETYGIAYDSISRTTSKSPRFGTNNAATTRSSPLPFSNARCIASDAATASRYILTKATFSTP